MPKLPLEVVQIIFTVSFPRPHYFDDYYRSPGRSRYDFLLPLCLIHPSLTRSIQRILFADIVLRDMERTRRFLESLKLVPEFKGWVKTLELERGDEGSDAENNGALSTIVKHCVGMEEVELACFEGVNLALFAQLKHLRSLKCSWLHLPYFEPIFGKSTTFESLVSLSFAGGDPIRLLDTNFFAPGVLPSLRRLSIISDGGKGPLNSITDLYDIASQLRHLSLALWREIVDPLLDKCTALLSLGLTAYNNVSSTRRFSKPLVGFRIRSELEDQDSDYVIERLEEALSSGLISASADSRTAIFVSGIYGFDDLSGWAESVGLELQCSDGALDSEWRSSSLDDGYSEFTKWVDDEAARREAVAEERRIKR